MNINGTVYLADERSLDFLKQVLSTHNPPCYGAPQTTVMCVDLDDLDNMLEMWFPNHTQKGTLLLPPPISNTYLIDGLEEEFIQSYDYYLDTSDAVQDYIASILFYLYLGGNIIIYVPNMDNDVIWLNRLMLYFLSRYGITIGTPNCGFGYDINYDPIIMKIFYSRGLVDIIQYLNSVPEPYPDPMLANKIYSDIQAIMPIGSNPLQTYQQIVTNIQRGIPIRNVVSFGTN